MKKPVACIFAAILLATSTAWGWGDQSREKVIDGRTFSYRYQWDDGGHTNVNIYAISPQDGDIMIPSRIDDCDNVGLGTIVVGWSEYQNIAGPGTTSVRLPRSATYIPNYCFQGCGNLTNINLECVTTYGMYAFEGCSNLVTTVHVRTNTVFRFTSYVNNERSCTFSGCKSLKDVIIDEGVKSLGQIGVFERCGIESIKLPSTLQSMRSTFCGTQLREIDIPDSVKNIGGSFANCTNLVQATIGRGVESLERNDFSGCTALERVIFKKPSSVVKIDSINSSEGSFSRCTSLKEVEIPDGVVSLDHGVFNDCTELSRVVLPDSLRSIGQDVFHGCKGLKTINIPNGVINIGVSAFSASGLIEVVLPDGLKWLGDSMFFMCHSLTNVVIPSSVEVIGRYAFHECIALESLTIPDSVTRIGGYAFDKVNLPQIVIPNSVTNIGQSAFQGYTGEIVFGNPTPVFNAAFYDSYPAKVTFHGGLPAPANCVVTRPSTKYVVTSEYLHEWLPWFIENNLANYAVLDDSTQKEMRVALGEGGVAAVGVMSALGIAAARSEDANGATAVYAMPELSIASFDPSAGRVEVTVKPATGCVVSSDLVAECVAVEGSNDLILWSPVDSSVESEGYAGTGNFICVFDETAHRFYRVRVAPRRDN